MIRLHPLPGEPTGDYCEYHPLPDPFVAAESGPSSIKIPMHRPTAVLEPSVLAFSPSALDYITLFPRQYLVREAATDRVVGRYFRWSDR